MSHAAALVVEYLVKTAILAVGVCLWLCGRRKASSGALSRLERDILDDCAYGGVDVIRLRLMLAATHWFGRPRWRDLHEAVNRLEKAGYLGTRMEPRLGNKPKLVLYTLPKGWQALGRPHKPHRAHR